MKGPRVAALFGAGFSKHYGGFLSSDILGQIITHPRINEVENMRQWLIDLGDYEKAIALDKRFDEAVKRLKGWDLGLAKRLQEIVLDVFVAMDRRMSADFERDDLNYLDQFVSRFDQGHERGGYIFTLNQDLLLERHVGKIASSHELRRPGTASYLNDDERFTAWFNTWSSSISLSSVTSHLFPSKARINHRFNYIKLHGSIDWYDEQGRLVIMGGDKMLDVQAHPLLKRYWSMFQTVMKELDRLFICGYGFGDDHVNREIVKAARRGTTVFIWDDLPLRQMRETWKDKGIEQQMRDALCGYVTIPLVKGIGEFNAVPPALDWFFQ
ncbi:MAG: SIR2 family protein [Armatimonadetes bacterium]|nr:SIR2 family protein [Armatimonadota bacterium]